VSDFAYKYLTRDRAVSVVFEPEEGGSTAASPSGSGPARGARSGLGRAGEPERPGARGDPTGGARARAGRPARFRLQNGLEVVEVQRAALPSPRSICASPAATPPATPTAWPAWPATARSPATAITAACSRWAARWARITARSSRATPCGCSPETSVNGLAVLADQVSCRRVDDASLPQTERADEGQRRAAARARAAPSGPRPEGAVVGALPRTPLRPGGHELGAAAAVRRRRGPLLPRRALPRRGRPGGGDRRRSAGRAAAPPGPVLRRLGGRAPGPGLVRRLHRSSAPPAPSSSSIAPAPASRP
jgi:hypothetical protein